MKLLVMLFFVIDIVHASALSAFFDVLPAVAEVSSYFRLGEQVQAVVAALCWFGHNISKRANMNNMMEGNREREIS